MKQREIMEAKLARMLSEKRQPIEQQVEHIAKTGSLIHDYLVDPGNFGFWDAKHHIGIQFATPTGYTYFGHLHSNALMQLSEKYNVPYSYMKTLACGKEWERKLAIENLKEQSINRERDGMFLVRTLPKASGESDTMAILSDKYKRLNSAKIYLTFLAAAANTGAQLIDAHGGDTRSWMEVVYPEVVDVPTRKNGMRFLIFGMQISSSDFGRGALELRAYAKEMKCWNGLVGNTMLREVHMGGTIPDNIELSIDTINKDTEARAALVRDAMNTLWKPQYKERMIEALRGASEQVVDLKKETESLPKLGLTKDEIEVFEKLMMNNKASDGLTGAPTMLKFISGITAVARNREPERRRELEKVAGAMIDF